MNAEYIIDGKTTQFQVQDQDGQPPHTARITERSTCGKYTTERIFVYDYTDVKRNVAVYSLVGTGQRKEVETP